MYKYEEVRWIDAAWMEEEKPRLAKPHSRWLTARNMAKNSNNKYTEPLQIAFAKTYENSITYLVLEQQHQ